MNETEIWEEINNSEYYFISNFGRVKKSKNGKEKILKGTLIHCYLICFGYKRKKQFSIIIHREVGLKFVPNPNNYKFLEHKDGNKQNNAFDNLEWVKTKKHKEYIKGYNHGKKILTAEQEKEIVKKRIEGELLKNLAVDYNVSITTIHNIIKKEAN